MTERCTNCGSELFAGQQFCRRCGQRTAPLEGEAPTRILSDELTPTPPTAAGTTFLPQQRGTGEAMWGPRHTGQQTPFANFAHTSPLPADAAPPQGTAALAPKKGRRWLVPLLLGLLLVSVSCIVIGVALFSLGPRRMVVMDKGRHPPAPPAPPGLGADASALDEAGAVVTADETVVTKTFEVGDDASFSLKGMQGDITVEGWDEDRVEVKLTKRGGTAEDRRAARVMLNQTDDSLALASADSRQIKVSYEVKVPRSMEKVELALRSGDVRASQLRGPLAVSLQNGDIELEDVVGPVEAKLINGDIEVVYGGAEREGAHEITNVNGDISVRLAEGMDADLTASIVNGGIDVDSRLGFQAQKRTPGWHVDTRLGDGGEPITVKSVNGSIKFKR